MDITSIDKIINRKRLCEKVDEIQEKIRKENKKMIQLFVDQDSAIWEYKENLATMKAKNERLELQLLQLQMENQSLLSKNHQEELVRPEINRGGKLVGPNTEMEKEGGAGVDMTSFPSFKFAEPKLVVPMDVGGKLVGPNPEMGKEGSAGVDMTSFPSFKFAEPKLVVPMDVGGKLVGPNPEMEKEGSAGVDMTSFPSFKFAEPKLVVPMDVGGKLVGLNTEMEKEGGAGVDMTSFPSFEFAEPKLVVPMDVGGKLVGPNPNIEKELKFGGGAGVDMTSFPSFKFAERIRLVVPIDVRRKLVRPYLDIEKKLKAELEKHERQLGIGAGVDMTSFPSIKFEERIRLVVPIDVRRKLVGPEFEKELKTDLEKLIERQFGGGAGVDMTSFPSFKFEEPKLDPIEEQAAPAKK